MSREVVETVLALIVATVVSLLLWWWLVLDADAQSMKDIVIQSEHGHIPSRQEFEARGKGGGRAPATAVASPTTGRTSASGEGTKAAGGAPQGQAAECRALKSQCVCLAAQFLAVEQAEPQRIERWRDWEWCHGGTGHPEAGVLVLRRFYRIESAGGSVQVPLLAGGSEDTTVLYPVPGQDAIMTAPLY